MKTQYLDEITGGKGVIFATGTPVSNSMVELYTMQRYLQYKTLEKNGLQHFDAWASTFGETVTAMELAPEGTGYRMKTRFAKFFNLPELISMFKETADITGIVLTKLDGTAKGGIAIAIQAELGVPVKYIGIGEKIEDLQKFDTDAFVDALFTPAEEN